MVREKTYTIIEICKSQDLIDESGNLVGQHLNKVGAMAVELTRPDIYKFILEQQVTNGLGYLPVREAVDEIHEDSEIGLLRHLSNMDYVQEARSNIYGHLVREDLLVKLINTDYTLNELAEGLHKVVIPLIDKVFMKLNSQAESYSNQIRKLQDKLDNIYSTASQPKGRSKINKEGWFRRTLGKYLGK